MCQRSALSAPPPPNGMVQDSSPHGWAPMITKPLDSSRNHWIRKAERHHTTPQGGGGGPRFEAPKSHWMHPHMV